MSDPTSRAAELQLDAVLGEVCGTALDASAEARLAARLRHETDSLAVRVERRSRWRSMLFAAAVVGGGVAVVWAVSRSVGNAPAGQFAVPDAPQDPPPKPQDQPQDELTKRVAAAARRFEMRDQRLAVWHELDGLMADSGRAVVAQLAAAERAARERGQAEVAAGLADLLTLLTPRLGYAKTGVTLFADYSENQVRMVDLQGKTIFQLDEVFGAWDAELCADGSLLLTEFSVSRVRRVTPAGVELWGFENLKNPYDADQLANGNVLIADTFAGRVIEVDRAGAIVWSHEGVRPFDADRLGNGNTLVADTLAERVLEVDPAGKVVWQLGGMPLAHDVDRLLDGNTLITLRDRRAVIEVDAAGKVVFELSGLRHPSGAARLANGNTLVAENSGVREFDRAGKEVWKVACGWAVGATRY